MLINRHVMGEGGNVYKAEYSSEYTSIRQGDVLQMTYLKAAGNTSIIEWFGVSGFYENRPVLRFGASG